MQAIFYNFSKKENSTAVPSEEGTTVEITLKERTNVENPTIEINSNTYPAFTYVYIPEFARYYFVSNWSYYRGLWSCDLSCDVLASHRSSIASYTTFIERSSSNYDNYINDPELTQRQSISHLFSSSDPIPNWSGTGCYLVRVVGGTSGSSSGITTYVVDSESIKNLLNWAFSGDSYTGIADDVTKSLFNPMQYIVSIMWFPLDFDTVAGSNSENIKLGWWESSAVGYPIPEGTVGKGSNITINRPEPFFNDWRDNNSNFSSYRLWLPTVGMVDVDAMDLSQGLQVSYYYDFITGNSNAFLVNPSTSNIFASYSGRVGIPIQIGQNTTDIGNVISSVASAASSLAAKDYLSTATSTVNAIKNVVQKSPQVFGNVGSMVMLVSSPNIGLYRTTYGAAEYPSSVSGRPCMKNLQLGTLRGFTKCGNASINISGYDTERQKINSYLNNGFYIE